ncbi:DUF4294 domain-containing protein [Aquimarina muelleri]|uniref:DUF4294 domain-containing protein n=1 Tax=Aquimarina muelleri TaxID=279356 RepID=A0A918N391_9FLAO|nr:DUF4294 domain-containing protein [Aquimarina muelleri]MCX2764631.1 DUF4294 domain-containing protein [Aquimarina muelleri]GGX25263.1 hypothetical protein GCM10007384_27900 [Aquimarina muelleri]
MFKYILYIISFGFVTLTYAQKENKNKVDSSKVDTAGYVQYYIIEGDTIPHEAIDLDEVVILGKLKFKDKLAKRKYLILRRKTRKVYPYAKLASDRLKTLNDRLEGIGTKRSKRKYIKILQKYMEEEFTKELKKLTRTEGQILVKLIHRQTGKTMFELVKEYRSGWKAFWYNNTAKLFNISLKEKYDPINIEEDYWIEDILQRSFQTNILKEQKTALDFSFYDLRNKWTDSTKKASPKK